MGPDSENREGGGNLGVRNQRVWTIEAPHNEKKKRIAKNYESLRFFYKLVGKNKENQQKEREGGLLGPPGPQPSLFLLIFLICSNQFVKKNVVTHNFRLSFFFSL